MKSGASLRRTAVQNAAGARAARARLRFLMLLFVLRPGTRCPGPPGAIGLLTVVRALPFFPFSKIIGKKSTKVIRVLLPILRFIEYRDH